MIVNYEIRLKCVPSGQAFHYYRGIQTDKLVVLTDCPDHEGEVASLFVIEYQRPNIPTCVGNSPTNLDIRTNVGTEIVDDDYTVTADPSDKKWIKMVILRDDTSTDIEIYAFEKTTGEYGSVPSGKTHEKDLKEFSVVASGTVLVEEEDFI